MSKLSEVEGQNADLKSRLKGLRKTAEKGMTSAVSAAVAGGTGFALGLAAAYNQDQKGKMPTVSDVPYSVVAAVLAMGFSMTTKSESAAEHFRSAGNAALGIAAYEFGKEKGKEWEEEDDGTSSDTTKGRARQLTRGVRGAVDRMTGHTSDHSHAISAYR